MPRRDRQKLRPLCREATDFSDHELSMLAAIENPSHELVFSVQCEIEAGHAGDHWALAQASGKEDEWWLRWDSTKRHLGTLAACPAHMDATDVDCMLPADHAGAHSFQLQPGDPRLPAAPLLERIEQAAREAGWQPSNG